MERIRSRGLLGLAAPPLQGASARARTSSEVQSPAGLHVRGRLSGLLLPKDRRASPCLPGLVPSPCPLRLRSARSDRHHVDRTDRSHRLESLERRLSDLLDVLGPTI